VASAKAKKLTEAMVNANINPFSWLNDNHILVKCFLKNRAALLDKRFTNWSDYFEC
jgi:hypothetical protein